MKKARWIIGLAVVMLIILGVIFREPLILRVASVRPFVNDRFQGWVNMGVPEDELDREVESLASKLSEKSLKAMAAIKGALERSLGMSLDDVLSMEAAQQAILFQSKEHKEAVQAFLKSRGKIA